MCSAEAIFSPLLPECQCVLRKAARFPTRPRECGETNPPSPKASNLGLSHVTDTGRTQQADGPVEYAWLVLGLLDAEDDTTRDMAGGLGFKPVARR